MALNKAASSSRHPAAPKIAPTVIDPEPQEAPDGASAPAARESTATLLRRRAQQPRAASRRSTSPRPSVPVEAEEPTRATGTATTARTQPEPDPGAVESADRPEPGETTATVLSMLPPVRTTPVTAPVVALSPGGVGEGLVLPETPPGNVRRVEVSKRGKRDFNYSWARSDVQRMRAVYEEFRPVYRNQWQQVDPAGTYRLVFSAFVAKALLVGLENQTAWADTIRNDARKEPVEGGRMQVGLVWPVEVENRVVEAWESYDTTLLPEGFALTKQHFASAAILYGLGTVTQWVMSVPNDDRFNVPVDTDGRLRHNRGTGEVPANV